MRPAYRSISMADTRYVIGCSRPRPRADLSSRATPPSHSTGLGFHTGRVPYRS